MNQSTLNGNTLGSGNPTYFVRLAATQVMQLAGSMGTSLRKYGSATTELISSGNMRVLGYISVRLAGTLALSGVFTESVWRRVYGAAVQFSDLVSEITYATRVRLKVYREATMSSSLVQSVWRRVPEVVVGTASLTGSLTGLDIYSGAAPKDRRVALSDPVRRISVPGSVTSIGV